MARKTTQNPRGTMKAAGLEAKGLREMRQAMLMKDVITAELEISTVVVQMIEHSTTDSFWDEVRVKAGLWAIPGKALRDRVVRYLKEDLATAESDPFEGLSGSDVNFRGCDA